MSITNLQRQLAKHDFSQIIFSMLIFDRGCNNFQRSYQQLVDCCGIVEFFAAGWYSLFVCSSRGLERTRQRKPKRWWKKNRKWKWPRRSTADWNSPSDKWKRFRADNELNHQHVWDTWLNLRSWTIFLVNLCSERQWVGHTRSTVRKYKQMFCFNPL